MYDIQHRDDRKRAIDKSIVDTQNKKRKTIAVGITTENQSVVAARVL